MITVFPEQGQRGNYDSDSTTPARVDASTSSWQTIEYPHHEIHSGSHFICYHYAAGKNDGDEIAISFRTPDTTKWIHVLANASASGAAYFYITENSTITDDSGTNLAIYNNNRNSITPSTVWNTAENPDVQGQAVEDVTWAGGTAIYRESFGSGNRAGGGARSDAEFVLKQNEDYVFVVQSDAAGLNLGLVLEWYEHTDHN